MDELPAPPGAFFAYLRGIFSEKADYIEIEKYLC
jgi:hypothetical protein